MPIDFPNSPTNGQTFTSGSTSWTWDGTKWNLVTNIATSNDSMPVGSILWYANTSTVPPGWIAADGSAVSRTTYATLFTVIGTTYGSGDGSTTFNVPSVAATTGKYYIRYTTSLGTVTTTSLSTAPVGTMLDWPTTSSYPTGYLRADGSAVSRTSYADLFSLIGTTYGSGDGSTTFNLPNLVAAGTGSPVKIIKASLGGTVEPSTVAHASSHTEGGSDVVTVTGNQIANYQTYRNVIINGAMQVAQRNTSVASITTTGYRTADRWNFGVSSLGTWTQSVENDAPTGSGFRKSLKMLCTTADASPAAGDYAAIEHRIEGQNLQHFAKGTSSAKKWAVSFWVKSNKTGTYIFELYDNDNSRQVSAAYTISVADTWEKKTISIPADTTGVFDNDNALSLYAFWWLGAGSNFTSGTLNTSWASVITSNRLVGQVNVAAAINNYWQITGIQLEAGDVTTPFEFEPYETTLRKCQRYYSKSYNPDVVPGTNTDVGGPQVSVSTDGGGLAGTFIRFPVIMRATPTTITYYTITGTSGSWSYGRNGAGATATMTSYGAGCSGVSGFLNTGAAWVVAIIYGHWTADAEL